MNVLEGAMEALFTVFLLVELGAITEMGVVALTRGEAKTERLSRIIEKNDLKFALALVLAGQMIGALLAWHVPDSGDTVLTAGLGSIGGGYLLHRLQVRWAQTAVFIAVLALGGLAAYVGLG